MALSGRAAAHRDFWGGSNAADAGAARDGNAGLQHWLVLCGCWCWCCKAAGGPRCEDGRGPVESCCLTEATWTWTAARRHPHRYVAGQGDKIVASAAGAGSARSCLCAPWPLVVLADGLRWAGSVFIVVPRRDVQAGAAMFCITRGHSEMWPSTAIGPLHLLRAALPRDACSGPPSPGERACYTLHCTPSRRGLAGAPPACLPCRPRRCPLRLNAARGHSGSPSSEGKEGGREGGREGSPAPGSAHSHPSAVFCALMLSPSHTPRPRALLTAIARFHVLSSLPQAQSSRVSCRHSRVRPCAPIVAARGRPVAATRIRGHVCVGPIIVVLAPLQIASHRNVLERQSDPKLQLVQAAQILRPIDSRLMMQPSKQISRVRVPALLFPPREQLQKTANENCPDVLFLACQVSMTKRRAQASMSFPAVLAP